MPWNKVGTNGSNNTERRCCQETRMGTTHMHRVLAQWGSTLTWTTVLLRLRGWKYDGQTVTTLIKLPLRLEHPFWAWRYSSNFYVLFLIPIVHFLLSTGQESWRIILSWSGKKGEISIPFGTGKLSTSFNFIMDSQSLDALHIKEKTHKTLRKLCLMVTKYLKQ